jgi:archaellum component FlaC
MIDIDTSTEAVAKISDDLMMTARVGTDNVRHAQLMDDASNVLNALQARIEGVKAKLAKAVEALRELREDVGNLGDNICYCQEAVDRDLHITAYRIGEDARAVLDELEKPE